MKKIISLVLALAMILVVAAASAATIKTGNGGESATTWAGTGPASIKVTLPTYTADEIAAGATNNNTYKIYKVFDATVAGNGISYTLMSGKTEAPTGFTADAHGYVTYSGSSTTGELTPTDIANLKEYIKNDTPVVTVTTENDSSFTVTGLEYGYYFIDTTVGTFVTVNSTKPNANVEDKNDIPPLNKKITGASSIDAAGKKAIEEIGKPVEYTITTKIQKGAENYILYDKMSTGLKFNEDVKIYTQNPKTVTGATELGASNYTTDYTATNDYTFKVSIDNDWAAANEDQELWVVYSATVTKDALTTEPEKNTAHLDFGHTPGLHHTPTVETETYGATISVYKEEEVPANTEGAVEGSDGKWYKPLAGAGFVLKNSEGNYYKYNAATDSAVASISWVTSIDEATEFTSQQDGNLDGIFKGLAAGTYTLVEKTVPASYTKADDIDITINPANYTGTDADKVFKAENLIQSRTVENKQGTVLPHTGGIGTTIFYILGGLLVVGAAVILVARRKAQD